LQVTNPGNAMQLHRMLQGWNDTDSWNSLASGIQANNVEAASAADATTGLVGTGLLTIDVTASLTAWVGDPAANLGWALLPTGTNAVDYFSAEGTTPPRLVVEFNGACSSHAPQASNDSYALQEDTPLNIPVDGVLTNDTDADSDPLTAILVAGPTSAQSFSLNSDGSFNYTPLANFSGGDSFTYQANDGTENSNLATVTITVNEINDAPVAMDDAYSLDQDTSLNVPAAGVLTNDSDVEGDLLTTSLVSGASNGTVVLNSDGSFTYTPTPGFVGTDSFTYQADDAADLSNVATVSIDVLESAESTFTFTDWGSVEFNQLDAISVAGESWYRIESTSNGYLTAEGLFDSAGGQINLELYDSNLQLVDAGNAVNGTSRVDAYVASGDEFFLKAVGSNSDVDFRLTNLVSVSGTTINVSGTAGDDAFVFTAGDTHIVSVNDVSYDFVANSISDVNFNGGVGTDTISITGTSQYEVATLRFGSATVTGSGFSVDAQNVEDAEFFGLGGDDRAYMYDSAGNDVFTVGPRQGVMQGEGFEGRVDDVYRIYAYGSAGYDQIYFQDSTGNDIYWSNSELAKLYGSNFHNLAENFDRSYAYASEGADKAYFFDSAGNDYYWADPNVSKAYGTGFHNRAEGFSKTYAYSTGGQDKA
jgi:VCBS repeat-containing protein